jgi:poly(ADP-ribose) glycohydrolase
MSQEHYILPSSPSYRCLDRFSLLPDDHNLEDQDGLVPFWPVLEAIVAEPAPAVAKVAEHLDTIATILRGSSGPGGDYGQLKDFFSTSAGPNFGDALWPKIVQLALQLPAYFPEGYLHVLRPGLQLRLSRGQAACLVAHQFLCTLRAPSSREDFQDFSIWYSSKQRHPLAVSMYLSSIVTYFDRLPDLETLAEYSARELAIDNAGIIYSLHESRPSSSIDDWANIPLTPIEVLHVTEYDTKPQEWEVSRTAQSVVISANKVIGFGESATQEEIFVGNAPEACPAVLVTPTLKDDQVLVVSGAKPMLSIRGERRDISWEVERAPDVNHDFDAWLMYWRGGTMLFMDALELDLADDGDGLPDMRLDHIGREFRKAVTAFSSGKYNTIWTGLWGCGAFGGDPAVKMTILWIAASVTGCKLKIRCEVRRHDFSRMFEAFARQVVSSDRNFRTRDLYNLLVSTPTKLRQLEILEWILNQVNTAAYR